MDAKQACDKLNGFNFQNRYLVGTLTFILHSIGSQADVVSSIIPPAREDGQVKRGHGDPQGEPRTPQEAARYRLTIRRVYRTPPDNSKVCRPVFSSAFLGQVGFGETEAKPQERQAEFRRPPERTTSHAALRAQATADGAGGVLVWRTIASHQHQYPYHTSGVHYAEDYAVGSATNNLLFTLNKMQLMHIRSWVIRPRYMMTRETVTGALGLGSCFRVLLSNRRTVGAFKGLLCNGLAGLPCRC